MNEVLQCLKERRSCRKYTGTQISDEQLNAILEAGTYAPTGRGAQSPCIVVLQKPEDIAEVSRMNAAVMGTTSDPFYGAPTVLIVFADTERGTWVDDGNMVMANLLNAAQAVGVDSCYIYRAREVFDTEAGRALMKKWGVPETCRGVGNCILGYGAEGGKRALLPRKEGYIIRV